MDLVKNLALALALLSGGTGLPAATAQVGVGAAPPPMRDTCAVLLGGGGMVFESYDQNAVWFRINGAISQRLAENLSRRGYEVHPVIVGDTDGTARLVAVVRAMRDRGCSHMVQVTHSLGGGTTPEGIAKEFSFEVKVLFLDGQAQANVMSGVAFAFGGDYAREYVYPLTPEVMDILSATEIAERMATDLEAATALRKGAP